MTKRCDYEDCDREATYELRRSRAGGADLFYACNEHRDALAETLNDESVTRHVTTRRT